MMLKAVAAAATPEKSMEDVWKDLSLPSAVPAAAGDRTVFQDLSLHDFLLVGRDPGITVLRLNPDRPSSLPHARSASPPPNGPSDHPSNKRGRHENGGDVRSKRMVKNRESAARSRARKQACTYELELHTHQLFVKMPLIAYTYELELEVVHLRKENAMLRKQQQNMDLCLAKEAPEVQPLKKPSLQRTLTAPF